MHSLILASAYFLYTACVGRFPSYLLRHLYLRRVLRLQIGTGASVHMGCFFVGRNIAIGSNSVVNRKCYLDGRGGITIGSNVSISPECYILSLTHDVHAPDFGTVAKPVHIGDRVWIGARVIILPGVTLGEGVVVGAGAVVTRDAAPYSIVAGNPAKPVGERSRELTYKLGYRPWFDTDIS